jgi:hypothetical protein
MTQALYAHMNNKTIKKKKENVVYIGVLFIHKVEWNYAICR